MKRAAARDARQARENGYLANGTMHPPAWNQNHRLLDWPDCTLDLVCAPCRHTGHLPCKLLAQRQGNRTFVELLPRLVCQKCRKAPTEMYLVAGHFRNLIPGPDPDWSIPLRVTLRR